MKQKMILVKGENVVRRIRLAPCLAAILMVWLFSPSLGHAGAGVFGERDGAATPMVIYVTDFELEAEGIQSEPGLLQRQREQRGRLGDVLPRPSRQKDPAVRARELVDLMSASLVKELVNLGLNARRLNAGETSLSDGLLVRGVFTHVDEGNRLRRAAIGFGAGETELQVVVSVHDLAQGSPKAFYELNAGAESAKKPGAIITLNPYAAAARFVLSGRDLDKSVVKTASKIAAEIAGRVGK